ncbi:hypothetical protein CPB83DRAFT_853058 [Crepidotus variabilis]|uniref:DUF1279 domain-containing protein n=1 Tax=Crepidotus variabilis TaxID=179855 RepID=A0A9P6EHQ5_9AGAR|nr:hypothetical protein CPB83DRAFT_853058 [Crepidotus variabilis]
MRPLRSVLPRVSVFRTIAPRTVAPLLPTTRPSVSALTNTPRPAGTQRLFTHFPARLSGQPRSPQLDPKDALPQGASISQKLRHLIKSYGWYALGVYMLFSVADFGVAFVGINLLGADYVSSIANAAKTWVMGLIHSKPPEPGLDEMDPINGHAQGGNEGLYAMLVLAYTVHKTLFMPIRVGLTAAFTPRIVSWLSKRGWAGSAGAKRAADEMKERIRERRGRGGSHN